MKIKLVSEILEIKKEKQVEFVKKWDLFSQLGCRSENVTTANNVIEEQRTLKEILDLPINNEKEPVESEIFYQSIVSFPEFLLIALDRFKEKPEGIKVVYNKEKLLDTFGFGETKVKWEENQVYSFMNLLDKQYSMFNAFFIKRDKEERYKFYRIIEGEVFTANEGGLIEKLKMFQSYLFVSREQNNWLKDAFDWIESNLTNKMIAAEDFLKELKKIDDKSHNDKKIRLDYQSFNRYWFWRLDYYLWENRKEF